MPLNRIMKNTFGTEKKAFLSLTILVTVAFVWIMLPFYGAIFWATITAIIFFPLQRRLTGLLRGNSNIAALVALLLVLLLVILPLALIAGSLIQQGSVLYESIRSGDINFGAYLQRAVDALPGFARELLARFNMTNVSAIQDKLSNGALFVSKFVGARALDMGQNAAHILIGFGIMLYLLFFLLRDGPMLSRRIRSAVPLNDHHKRHLFRKFATVAKATVKGNIAVAAVQGILGGVIFAVLGIQGALLWGTIMAFLSLLPAIGSAMIWGPVAIYFLLTGAVWKGVILIVFCVVVIGLIDNVLRPLLVGKDTQMPDYLVLISTLGGMAVFGLNGFVIGPLIAALFISCWDLYSAEKHEVSPLAEDRAFTPGSRVEG